MNVIFRRMFVRSSSRLCGIGMTGAVFVWNIHGQAIAASQTNEKTPVDALIPWLLQEDTQLRGIPFSEVVLDATGKHVLAFNPKDETDARVVKQISAVLDEVMARLNAPESVIRGIPRINEDSGGRKTTLRISRSGTSRSRIASRLLSRSETLRSREPRQFISHFLFRTEDPDQQSARGRSAFYC